jgi:hypothetical protein
MTFTDINGTNNLEIFVFGNEERVLVPRVTITWVKGPPARRPEHEYHDGHRGALRPAMTKYPRHKYFPAGTPHT